jgi:hypothetical protein
MSTVMLKLRALFLWMQEKSSIWMTNKWKIFLHRISFETGMLCYIALAPVSCSNNDFIKSAKTIGVMASWLFNNADGKNAASGYG